MKMKLSKFFTKGIIRDNIILSMVLGLCPTLATTTSAKNGINMGIAMVIVMLGSNIIISLIRNQVPDKVRIPVFIVIIASFTSIIEILLKAYMPAIYKALGIYIPLIVANCVPLVTAESSAAKFRVVPSMLAALGTGTGVIMAFGIIGGIREILGAGTFYEIKFVPENFHTLIIFVMPPGAFIVLGYLIMLFNKFKKQFYKRRQLTERG